MLRRWDANCSSYFLPLCFTATEKIIVRNCHMSDIETLLSCNTVKIGDTVPSLDKKFALSIQKSIHDDDKLRYKAIVKLAY